MSDTYVADVQVSMMLGDAGCELDGDPPVALEDVRLVQLLEGQAKELFHGEKYVADPKQYGDPVIQTAKNVAAALLATLSESDVERENCFTERIFAVHTGGFVRPVSVKRVERMISLLPEGMREEMVDAPVSLIEYYGGRFWLLDIALSEKPDEKPGDTLRFKRQALTEVPPADLVMIGFDELFGVRDAAALQAICGELALKAAAAKKAVVVKGAENAATRN